MTVRSRVFPADEEHGKRNDDFKSKNKSNSWLSKSSKTPIFRRKRVLGFIVGCVILYVFAHNVPKLGPQDSRYIRKYGRAYPEPREPANNGEDLWRQAQQADDPPDPPATPDTTSGQDAQDFEGPVRFYYLASSLHAISKTAGQRAKNKNILFTASDLKSAADLIPMACQMARWKKNNVHMALMGREEMAMDEVKKVNDVDGDLCPIFWHDARPDFGKRSTQHRMEVSVAGALGHIENFMHPQAVISNYPEHEEDFFVKSINRKTKELAQTHIQLPKGASETLEWMTRLDATALNSWHSATIDIVVQAPQKSSGSLIRLLKSLEHADYGAFLPPRLVLELPHKLEQDVMTFLDDFQWPPVKYQNHLPYQQLTLHRRIPERRLTDHEASTRFVESFYPYDTMDSHVLVLSPQAELSPTFFHYLKFNMLEYRYSNDVMNLFGISLETPSSYLNGSEAFIPPQKQSSSKGKTQEQTPFLWQAPNTGAALIFADKWVELHSFLTQYFSAVSHSKTKAYLKKRRKQASENLPAWAEYTLDLMRSRGYYMLYPGALSETSRGSSLAVLHNELYQIPEEYLKKRSKPDTDFADLPGSDDILEENDFSYLKTHHVSQDKDVFNVERPLLKNLAEVLPPIPKSMSRPDDEYDPPPTLPSLDSFPLLDYLGIEMNEEDFSDKAHEHTINYRIHAGGCSKDEAEHRAVIHGNAEDLFCISEHSDDEDLPDDLSDTDEAVERAGEALKKSAGRGDGRAKDSNKKTKPSSNEEPNNKKEGLHSKDTDHDDESDERTAHASDADPPTKQSFHGSGVAAEVDAVKDPASYAATAVAGFKAKLENPDHKYSDDIPTIDLKKKQPTAEELAEMQALRWKEATSGKRKDSKAPSIETDDREGDRPAGAAGAGGGPRDQEAERRGGVKEAVKAEKGSQADAKDEYDGKHTDEPPTATQTDEAGARPAPTDADSAEVSAQAEKAIRESAVKTEEQRKAMPQEPRDAAIGGKREAMKGRIGGWDTGGYDEAFQDERAAAAGEVEFAKDRARRRKAKQEKEDA